MCRRAQWGGPAQPKASNNITCDLLNMLFIQRRTAMDEDDRATWLLRNSQGSNANCWWCSSVLPNTHLSHTSIFGCTYVHHPLFPTPKTAVSSWHCIQWQGVRSHYLQHKVNLCSTAHRKMQRCSDAVMQWDCIVEACHQGLDLKVSRYIHCPKEDYKRVCTDLAGHEGKVQQLNVWIPDTISGKRAYSIPESSFTLRKQCWDAGEAGEQHEQQFSQEITLWRLKPTF